MLLPRILVAAVGLPLLALLLWFPEPVFSGVVEAILAVAAFEIVRAARPEAPLSAGIGAAAATALFVALARVYPEVPLWSFLVITAIAIALVLRPGSRLAAHPAGWWLVAVLYAAVPGAHLVLTRNLDDGVAWLILLLAAVFLTDIGAYATGRTIGRHRLAPRLSPNKTWEGAVGGLVLGAVATVVAVIALDLEPSTAGWAALAVVLPVAAMSGDLLESAMKRRLGVKDMSALLPGHGGVTDRLDSILAAGVCLYWIARWQT